MEISFDKRLKHAFVLDEETLKKKIVPRFSAEVGVPIFRTKCSDDYNRTFHSIHELVNYDNHSASRILSIDISIENKWFGPNLYFDEEEIRICVQGKEKDVNQFKTDMLRILDGAKPWYWRFRSWGGFWLANIIFFVVSFFAVGSLILLFLDNFIPNGRSLLASESFAGYFLLAFFIFPAFLTWLLNRAFSWLFPFSQFLIVQEKKAATRKNYLRGLFGSILLALLTSGLYQALFS